jgi:hypothetical protein
MTTPIIARSTIEWHKGVSPKEMLKSGKWFIALTNTENPNLMYEVYATHRGQLLTAAGWDIDLEDIIAWGDWPADIPEELRG